MGNKVALVKAAIWDDPAFRALTMPAQWLYFALLSQDDIDLCGTLAIRLTRWTDLAAGAKPAAVSKAFGELEQTRFIETDRKTEEALIRSYVRHAGTLKVPNVIVGMSRHWCKIRSSKLRSSVLRELPETALDIVTGKTREGLAEPFVIAFTQAKWGKGSVDPSPDPSGNGTGKGFGKGSSKGSPQPFPEGVTERVPVGVPPTAFPPFRLSASDVVKSEGELACVDEPASSPHDADAPTNRFGLVRTRPSRGIGGASGIGATA